MSNGRNKFQSRENRAVVDELLMKQWDPIGVGEDPDAAGEYTNYANRAYVMLMDEDADVDEIARYLDWIATVYMGLPGFPHQKSVDAAELLVSLKPSFNTH